MRNSSQSMGWKNAMLPLSLSLLLLLAFYFLTFGKPKTPAYDSSATPAQTSTTWDGQ